MNDDEDDFEDEFDCGYVPEAGICELAGTEDCEFDCPWRKLLDATEHEESRRQCDEG